jgi:hypothetical protein
MLNRTRVTTGLLVALTSAAHAGFFTTALSTEDASQLKRVAVVSVLGDTLRARQVGLTVFGNKSFDAQLPDWALDADVRALMQERIIASGRIKGVVEPLLVSTSDMKAILALALESGFDAVVAARPQEDANDRFLAPGPGTMYKSALGINHLCACDGMVVSIWRVSDGKRLGYSHPDQCTRLPIAAVWHDKWSDYTDAEKHTTLELVQSFVHQQIMMALSDLRLLLT